MKYASGFRTIARNALTGRWTNALLAGLLASLLGVAAANGPEITLNFERNRPSVGVEIAGQSIFSTGGGLNETLTGILVGGFAVFFVIALVMAVAYYALGCIVEVGYGRFNLDLVDRRKEPEIATLFGYFPHWRNAVAAGLLRGLYVLLWSLLFVIPGIVASYSYAMTSYILAENPELSASEAIERSQQMMTGNRWRLFCLNLSFIGWEFLSVLTLGIGQLWLVPYKQAAHAAFYREVSGTACTTSGEDPAPFEG